MTDWWHWASTLTLLILTCSRMTLSKASFSDILGNDYWDHSDTFGNKFDFYTFGFYTFQKWHFWKYIGRCPRPFTQNLGFGIFEMFYNFRGSNCFPGSAVTEYKLAQFIRSAKVSESNAFAYFSILKLAYAMLKKALLQ